MLLVRRNAVDIHGWLTEEEFNRDWALCQITPGINLIALTILVGRQVAGWRGVVIAMLGLVLPSAFLTALFTAAFVSIRDLPVVKGALRGILPATVGLGFVTAFQMARHPLHMSRERGRWQLTFAILVLAGSGALLWSGWVSVTVVLIVAGVIGAVENVIFERYFSCQRDGLE